MLSGVYLPVNATRCTASAACPHLHVCSTPLAGAVGVCTLVSEPWEEDMCTKVGPVVCTKLLLHVGVTSAIALGVLACGRVIKPKAS